MKQESNIENKPLLTSSRLFLEVSGVIGKVSALEELTKDMCPYFTYFLVGCTDYASIRVR